MTEETYLVRAWGVVGPPDWEQDRTGAGARARLTKPNRRDQGRRLAVYAVPPELGALPLDALIAAAAAGRLQRIFFDADASAMAEGSRAPVRA